MRGKWGGLGTENPRVGSSILSLGTIRIRGYSNSWPLVLFIIDFYPSPAPRQQIPLDTSRNVSHSLMIFKQRTNPVPLAVPTVLLSLNTSPSISALYSHLSDNNRSTPT